jgi:hypothetical protein
MHYEKPNLKEAWWKAMHLRRHWGFALNTYNILQPPHKMWDKKEDPSMYNEVLEGVGRP